MNRPIRLIRPAGLAASAVCAVFVAGVGLAACGQRASAPQAAPPPTTPPASPAASSAPAASRPPSAPEDGGPRNWTVRADGVQLRQEPSPTAALLTSFSAGTVLDNLGCRRVEGRDWCDVQPLGGGPRGFVTAELLEPAVAPHGAVVSGEDDSALRAGRGQFDATGKLPCAVKPDAALADCPFGVARAGGGYATVVVTRPDGMKRALFFRMGRAIGADSSEADSSGPFSARKSDDTYRIRVGRERYEVIEAVIFGG